MKLKELRKEKSLNQEDLSKFLNIAKSTYCGYELGTSEPNMETLIKLADFYNVTLDYLVGRQYNNDIGYLNEQERMLLEDFKKLNPINQIKILAEIKGILIAQN